MGANLLSSHRRPTDYPVELVRALRARRCQKKSKRVGRLSPRPLGLQMGIRCLARLNLGRVPARSSRLIFGVPIALLRGSFFWRWDADSDAGQLPASRKWDCDVDGQRTVCVIACESGKPDKYFRFSTVRLLCPAPLASISGLFRVV